MDDRKLEFLHRCREDLAFFSQSCLKVKAKDGSVVPLIFNESQRLLHAAIEKQRAECGWVRIIVLKGRKQGISTYVGARFYAQASLRRGRSVFILTQEQKASDTLFGMVDLYHRHNPLAPHVGASNEKELIFDRLDSGYTVSTAGQKATGRGGTPQLFHGSEVAIWPNAASHFAASVNSVPLIAGTEVILESTAAGPSGEYYERVQDAVAGRGDYRLVFLPWHVERDNARPAPSDFELSAEADDGEMSEREVAETYHLTNEQMFWRRNKIIELRDPQMMKQEFPADVNEAFVNAKGQESFIPALPVLRARKRSVEAGGPLILGVDPAGGGGDRFAVAARRGNRVLWVQHRNKIDQAEAVVWLTTLINEHHPARVFVDQGNIGAPLISTLRAARPTFADLVRGVNFGAPSEFKKGRPAVAGPKNRRAEMWLRLKEWLQGEEGVQIPDDDAIQSDITAPRRKAQAASNDLVLESKDDMKKRQVRSPDLADAICLTFASLEWFPVGSYVGPAAPRAPTGTSLDKRPVAAEYVSTDSGPLSWMG